MFDQNQSTVELAEKIAGAGTVNDVLAELRKLCLFDFGYLLLSMPNEKWPHLSRLLPRMASDEVQRSWAGESGSHMLLSSTNFIEIMNRHFVQLCHRTIWGTQVLDYGCGYGRLMRLMYYFTDPKNIYGVDPWEKSIEVCRQDGLLGTIVQSEYLPSSLAVPENYFDIICSYSVFTHTSMKITLNALRILRRYISPSGVLVLTTRPLEYWSLDSLRERPGFELGRQVAAHRETGYSFFPSSWNMPADGESIFGDTSFDLNWISKNLPEWSVRSYDRGLDSYQVIIFLTPR